MDNPDDTRRPPPPAPGWPQVCATRDCGQAPTTMMISAGNEVAHFCDDCADYLAEPVVLRSLTGPRWRNQLRAVPTLLPVVLAAVVAVPALPATRSLDVTGWILLGCLVLVAAGGAFRTPAGRAGQDLALGVTAFAGCLWAPVVPWTVVDAAVLLYVAARLGGRASRWYAERHPDERS